MDRISEAVKSLDSQGKPNVAKNSSQFHIPPSRLRNRWNGRRSKTEVVDHNRTLSEAYKLAICQYLDYLNRRGPKARYKQPGLAEAGSGELAEDELKGVCKAEMERAARRKSTNRVVEKGGVITVGKARQGIAGRKAMRYWSQIGY